MWGLVYLKHVSKVDYLFTKLSKYENQKSEMFTNSKTRSNSYKSVRLKKVEFKKNEKR